ncbi:hypothetical protein Pmani_009474 [Petrolisthes manimaculis]|uniref:Uncharacterized protein n=1 Tax=Petrolisthes manimaculis TaxID=1843537 RepID=A0AAE1Q3E5_9EUCA|nr:hypothetical protein Pmani_009474 [Petrolisthes manimaculis]
MTRDSQPANQPTTRENEQGCEGVCSLETRRELNGDTRTETPAYYILYVVSQPASLTHLPDPPPLITFFPKQRRVSLVCFSGGGREAAGWLDH